MADEIRRLIDDLGKVPKELKRELRPGLRKAAAPMLAAAKANASWSTRIPRATRISITFSGKRAGVAITVNKNRAPHARPYEMGSGSGRSAFFRHPVYGHDVWVSQKTRPFLWPAFVAHRDDAEREIADVVDTVTREAGFR